MCFHIYFARAYAHVQVSSLFWLGCAAILVRFYKLYTTRPTIQNNSNVLRACEIMLNI